MSYSPTMTANIAHTEEWNQEEYDSKNTSVVVAGSMGNSFVSGGGANTTGASEANNTFFSSSSRRQSQVVVDSLMPDVVLPPKGGDVNGDDRTSTSGAALDDNHPVSDAEGGDNKNMGNMSMSSPIVYQTKIARRLSRVLGDSLHDGGGGQSAFTSSTEQLMIEGTDDHAHNSPHQYPLPSFCGSSTGGGDNGTDSANTSTSSANHHHGGNNRSSRQRTGSTHRSGSQRRKSRTPGPPQAHVTATSVPHGSVFSAHAYSLSGSPHHIATPMQLTGVAEASPQQQRSHPRLHLSGSVEHSANNNNHNNSLLSPGSSSMTGSGFGKIPAGMHKLTVSIPQMSISMGDSVDFGHASITSGVYAPPGVYGGGVSNPGGQNRTNNLLSSQETSSHSRSRSLSGANATKKFSSRSRSGSDRSLPGSIPTRNISMNSLHTQSGSSNSFSTTNTTTSTSNSSTQGSGTNLVASVPSQHLPSRRQSDVLAFIPSGMDAAPIPTFPGEDVPLVAETSGYSSVSGGSPRTNAFPFTSPSVTDHQVVLSAPPANLELDTAAAGGDDGSQPTTSTNSSAPSAASLNQLLVGQEAAQPITASAGTTPTTTTARRASEAQLGLFPEGVVVIPPSSSLAVTVGAGANNTSNSALSASFQTLVANANAQQPPSIVFAGSRSSSMSHSGEASTVALQNSNSSSGPGAASRTRTSVSSTNSASATHQQPQLHQAPVGSARAYASSSARLAFYGWNRRGSTPPAAEAGAESTPPSANPPPVVVAVEPTQKNPSTNPRRVELPKIQHNPNAAGGTLGNQSFSAISRVANSSTASAPDHLGLTVTTLASSTNSASAAVPPSVLQGQPHPPHQLAPLPQSQSSASGNTPRVLPPPPTFATSSMASFVLLHKMPEAKKSNLFFSFDTTGDDTSAETKASGGVEPPSSSSSAFPAPVATGGHPRHTSIVDDQSVSSSSTTHPNDNHNDDGAPAEHVKEKITVKRPMRRDVVSEILKGCLYLTSARGMVNHAALDGYKITAFLGVASDVPMPAHVLAGAPGPSTVVPHTVADSLAESIGATCGGSGAYEYLHLPLKDRGTTQLSDYFPPAFEFIRNCIASGRRVAVFCREGKSRSASFVIAFIMEVKGVTYEQALEYVRLCRETVDPNLGFCTQLSSVGSEPQ